MSYNVTAPIKEELGRACIDAGITKPNGILELIEAGEALHRTTRFKFTRAHVLERADRWRKALKHCGVKRRNFT